MRRFSIFLVLAIFPLFADIPEGLHEKCTELVFQKIMYHRWELCSVFSNKAEDLMLSQIENLKSEGISEEELTLVRLQLLSQLNVHAKSADRLDEEMLAACRYTIENIQLTDLSYLLSQFLNEEQHSAPTETMHSHWVPVHFADNVSSEAPLFFLASSGGHIESFYQLPLEDRERKLIHELIRTIAEKSIWGLLFKKREVEKLGKKVEVVHPMRFMGHILSEPKLRKWLKDIRHSSFKWDYFMNAFSDRMKEENAKNNVVPYVPGMAHLLHVEPSYIMSYIQDKDYIGLVKSFL